MIILQIMNGYQPEPSGLWFKNSLRAKIEFYKTHALNSAIDHPAEAINQTKSPGNSRRL